MCIYTYTQTRALPSSSSSRFVSPSFRLPRKIVIAQKEREGRKERAIYGHPLHDAAVHAWKERKRDASPHKYSNIHSIMGKPRGEKPHSTRDAAREDIPGRRREQGKKGQVDDNRRHPSRERERESLDYLALCVPTNPPIKIPGAITPALRIPFVPIIISFTMLY